MIPIPDRLTMKLILGIGCALLLALLIHDRNHWKAKTAHYSELLSAERGAHAATVANYRQAAERARALDSENAARVKTAQAAINEGTIHDLESRIADARATAQRLRANANAAAHSGAGGATLVPGLSVAAQGVAAGAGQDRLSQADALTATEQAIQLDELINWVKAQAGVEVSGR